MDFGRPLIYTPGIVSKSGIRLVPENHLGTDPLDVQCCQAANEAAIDLLLGGNHNRPPSKTTVANVSNSSTDNNDVGSTPSSSSSSSSSSNNKSSLVAVDCTQYTERHLPPPTRNIRPGDLVVIFESFNDLNFVYAKPGDIFSNRNGHFHHNDFIGKPYGCKIRSHNMDGLGFLYLLRPTPELWTRSLPHRTQIVHELDASMIIHYLELRPNMIVCESGTGSGAMSHAILRSIAPCGKLHTYEFNGMRATKAKKEFVEHGLGHLVQVYHRDVCGKVTLLNTSTKKCNLSIDLASSSNGDDDDDDGNAAATTNDEDVEDDGRGGFLIGQAKAHAIFLDLPEPWLAIPHAAYTLRPNGRIGTYSPCMEQTQRTCAALRRHGFHSLRTVEARLQEYFVSEVDMECPPFTCTPPNIITDAVLSVEKARINGEAVVPISSSKVTDNGGVEQGVRGDDTKPEVIGDCSNSKKRKVTNKILCARPFSQMRGHTAYLTFATAGNAKRPDPNKM
jgi:tRNA (adenine57-N1/adenine58-N1)-methyltransferase